jgi:hypothetical protein
MLNTRLELSLAQLSLEFIFWGILGLKGYISSLKELIYLLNYFILWEEKEEEKKRGIWQL